MRRRPAAAPRALHAHSSSRRCAARMSFVPCGDRFRVPVCDRPRNDHACSHRHSGRPAGPNPEPVCIDHPENASSRRCAAEAFSRRGPLPRRRSRSGSTNKRLKKIGIAPVCSHGICTFRIADLAAPRRARDRRMRVHRYRGAGVMHSALVIANGTGAAWRSYFQSGSPSGSSCA